MKVRHVLLALLMSTSALAESESEDPQGRERDRPCRLEGSYSYELSGLVGYTAPSILLNEAGSLHFDGRGEGTGGGVTVINLPPPALRESRSQYAFSYTRLPHDAYLATGTATSDVGDLTSIRFVVSFGDCCEHISIVSLPNAALIPIPLPPLLPPQQALFNYSQVSGSGGK
jgi:hypothetical protein